MESDASDTSGQGEGLSDKASGVFDVVVIGAGPAGLSATLSLAREHFKVLVLEKSAIGGNLLKIADLENYAGFVGAGSELAQTMKEQAKKFGAEIQYAEALGVMPAVAAATPSGTGSPHPVATGVAPLQLGLPPSVSPSGVTVATAGNTNYHANAVIVANGMKPRELVIEGLKAPMHTCATCDGPLYSDKKVAVIGGGESAFQTALFLAGFAAHTYIISHSQPRVKGVLLNRVQNSPKITVLTDTEPSAELLDDNLQVAGVFLEIGSDRNELPKVAEELEGAPNVLRAGDCHDGVRRQVVAAVADGAAAAEKIREFLTA
jgi:thioredoxin reductase